MAKAPYKLPNVFVGCPYGGRFEFGKFKSTLERWVPFKFFYADTSLTTKHLLPILRTYLSTAEFCLFDISTWNPNVALEIGLAEGLGVEYYILVHAKLSQHVPSDIQGLQRIQYSGYAPLEDSGLVQQLMKYKVRAETHPRRVWESFGATDRKPKFLFAMGVLAHLRHGGRLSSSDRARVAQGTYLRRDAQDDVLEKLESLDLLRGVNSARGPYLSRALYRDDLRVK